MYKQPEFYDNFLTHFKEQQNNHRNTSYRAWIKKWIVNPNQNILDFGCAFGYNSQEFLDTHNVYGIDLSTKCIEYAKQQYPKGHWYSGNVIDGIIPHDLPQFDYILLSDVLEHVPAIRLPALLRVLSNYSKINGVWLISVPNSENHAKIKTQTPQPVEEKVKIPYLLQEFKEVNFSRVVSLFLQESYYRIVVQKVTND